LIKCLFFGLTQGMTEFLPVSSSGHLYILKRLFGSSNDLLPFFVLLHFSTLLAIIVFFRKQFLGCLTNKKVLGSILIITLITGVIGLTIDRFFKQIFESRYWVSFFLLVNAGVLLKAKNNFGKRNFQDITLKDSIFIGILQGLAVFPGISRSGITIVGFLQRGFKPQDAFKFSFIMVIPVIIGTFLFKMREIMALELPLPNVIGGALFAFLSGIVALYILKKSLINKSFSKFGYYCAFIALVNLI